MTKCVINYRIKIKELCNAHGINMRQLAYETSFCVQTLYYWNQGRAHPTLEMAIWLCQRFKLNNFSELIEPLK